MWGPGTNNYFDNFDSSERRLVDIGYIFNIIRKVQHKEFNYTFTSLKFEHEVRKGYS